MGQFTTNPIETLDEWNAVLANGCCCEMPGCCPPQLQCESLRFTAEKLGWVNPGDSDDLSDSSAPDGMQTRWAKRITRTIFTPLAPTTSDQYHVYGTGSFVTGASYDAISATGSLTEDSVVEFTNMIEWQVYGLADCFFEGDVQAVYCDGSGTITQTNKSGTRFSGVDHVWNSSTREIVVTDVGGDINPDHAVWETAFDAYKLAHPEFTGTTYDEVYASWLAAYNDWLAMEVPDPEVFPDPPTVDPGEFYPDCWFQMVDTNHLYEIDSGEVDFTVIEQDGSPFVFTTYGDNIDSIEHSSSATSIVYEDPMTHADFISAVNSWMDAYPWPEESDSGCAPASNCAAYAEWQLGFTQIVKQAFRYRWKLNKCCGTYSALSWLEVFYSKAFLDWLTDGGSGDAPDAPDPTTQAWEFADGVTPPECWESDSGSSDTPPLDPFDDELFWSPWSLVVKTPEGLDGEIHLRNLFMTCWRSVFGSKPQYIPLLDPFDSSDLNEDGIPDSEQ